VLLLPPLPLLLLLLRSLLLLLWERGLLRIGQTR
jgi:hypothetical protein